MSKRKCRTTWLNHACIGKAELSADGNIGLSLVAQYRRLAVWTAKWLRCTEAAIALCENTTQACDAAFIRQGGNVDICVLASTAHPVIQASVHAAARLIEDIRGRALPVVTFTIPETEEVRSIDLAEKICRRVDEHARGKSALVFLDHVTYRHGTKLPIEEIVGALTEQLSFRVVIDSAQAIGLWRPTRALHASYIGCYHKYAGAPAGTGFIALDGAAVTSLPYGMASSNIAVTTDDALCLPTADVQKWQQAAAVMCEDNALTEVLNRQRAVFAFNEAFESSLAPFGITLGQDCDPLLRSHISSVDCGTSEAARDTVELLAAKGVHVQQIDNLVRVSCGHGTQASDGERVGSLMRDQLQRLAGR